MYATRLLTLDDIPLLTDLLRANRQFLAPWEPLRPDAYFTVEGQNAVVREALARHRDGSALPHLILDETGEPVGRITLNGIVRGPFQSCSVGYWLSASHNGRGLAGAALRHIKQVAFEQMGLHRIQAETLLHNIRSQHVLNRNGFVRIGMAPNFLKIAGRWQDNILFQTLRTEDDEDEN